MAQPVATSDVQLLEELKNARGEILGELRKVIVGQDAVVEQLLTVLFANGHCLLVGVPGLAKTLLVSTLATILDLKFSRIQFTPDLMPSDITGTEILEDDPASGKRTFKFIRGPIFANMVLADEINRTPPKTQAALLQSMQEYRVTAGGTTYPLDLPFFVLATQNPIEFEGTYPLPEAQLDRFMYHISVGYPTDVEEEKIVATTTSAYEAAPKKVMGVQRILDLQHLVRRIPVSEHVIRYAVRLARASRPGPDSQSFVRDWVSWGAGPRAAQYLVLGAKARAAIQGRPTPGAEDVRSVAPAVLRHRIIPNFNAEADGISSLDIIAKLLETTPSVDGKHA
ncbi:MAG TPA: MoxR family ATPase [Candidatus Eisenbacteria bacterium]|jgi:MoxR-like ATPase|nr:MoxR family ATPase [Candidatus Eisenbacteria bacterium]